MRVFLGLFLCLATCSAQVLTRPLAAKLIEASPFGSRTKVAKVAADNPMRRCADSGDIDGWPALVAAGWVNLTQAGATCKAILTAAGQAHLRAENFGIEPLYSAVVARPGNIVVTGVSAEGSAAIANFTFEWVLTPAGQVLVEPFPPREATAAFRKFDDGWRCLGVEGSLQDEMPGTFANFAASGVRFRRVPWSPSQGGAPPADARIAALIEAAAFNVPEASRLLAAGVDPNAQNETGYTPLLFAAQYRAVDGVRLLLSKGAGVNVRAPKINNETPLIAAVRLFSSMNPESRSASERAKLTEVVQILLAAGADASARDAESQSALDYAKRLGDPEILRMLREASPAGAAAPMARALTVFHGRGFTLQHPPDWQATTTAAGQPIIAPPGGVSGNELTRGLMMTSVRALLGKVNLERDTQALVNRLIKRNPGMTVTSPSQPAVVGGSPAMLTRLSSTSPSTGQRDADLMVTVDRGALLYAFIFVVPEQDRKSVV